MKDDTDTFTGRWQGMVNLANVLQNTAIKKQEDAAEAYVQAQLEKKRKTEEARHESWGAWG